MFQALRENKIAHSFLSWLGLFGSLGTLVCCALPSALVLMGFGATLASALGVFPQLIWLSERKVYVFAFSFIMLGLSYLGQKYSEAQACPVDKKEDCETTKNWTKPIFWISFGINVIGVFYAFILPKILGY